MMKYKMNRMERGHIRRQHSGQLPGRKHGNFKYFLKQAK